MNKDQADRLKLGDSVYWEDDLDQAGVVTKVSDDAIFIEWDDGTKGWIDKRDMKDVYNDFVMGKGDNNQ